MPMFYSSFISTCSATQLYELLSPPSISLFTLSSATSIAVSSTILNTCDLSTLQLCCSTLSSHLLHSYDVLPLVTPTCRIGLYWLNSRNLQRIQGICLFSNRELSCYRSFVFI